MIKRQVTFNKSRVEVTSNDRNEATFTWKPRVIPTVMSGAFQESCQWLSVTEESLFLHDGLIRVTDLVELPRDVNNTQEGDNEVITFDLKSPKELSDRLLAVCGTQNNAYSRLLEYRLNALKGLWGAQKQVSVDEQHERESSTHEETIALLKKQGLFKEPEQASFSTRISVLLVIPLLQSQSKVDSSLCGVTAELLLNCLKDCAPLSLSKEPGDCLRGLENLLCTWLGEEKSEGSTGQIVKDVGQRRNAASALVALACARGHLKTFIHAVHLLQSLNDLTSLKVADILTKLLDTEGGQAQPTAILGSKHILCWGFEDMLGGQDKETQEKDKEKPAEGEIGRSITSDGTYLYTTNNQGKGLAKIGTGLHGSLRGYVYSRNLEIGPGKVAYGDNILLYRPQIIDQENELTNLCQVYDPYSLQPLKTVPIPEEYTHEGPRTTIAFCSDGTYFYWVWCPGVNSDKNIKGLSVFLEAFRYDIREQRAIPIQQRITLQKKDETSVKALNDSLMLSRLRPFRGNPSAASLVAFPGGDPINVRKEDAAMVAGSTTCGIPLKTLIKTPVYCDGTTLVFLTTLPGGATASSTARDGHYNTRTDLTDAPTCAIGRGAPVSGLGACVDIVNNMIWTCSNDWIDQFYNPGHQAPHHINRRLRIMSDQRQQMKDNEMSPDFVIKQLLQHVGSMCLHQVNNDLLHTPLGTYILQQHAVDLCHMNRICDILERAINKKDNQIIICTLIVLQLIFKVSMFKRERPGEVELLQKTSLLVWQLLTKYPQAVRQDGDLSAVLNEACQVITAGLHVLYPTSENKNNLLHQLLTNSGKNPALDNLRDMILIDFAEKLRGHTVSKDETMYLRLTDELVHHILKIAVKESCQLLQESIKLDKVQFEELQARVPCATPCLRYMMSLQSHLLREAVLMKVTGEVDEKITQNLAHLKDLQLSIVTLASKTFAGACQSQMFCQINLYFASFFKTYLFKVQMILCNAFWLKPMQTGVKVLEVLLDACNTVINRYKDDLELRLQGLERISKATILGHLLPVLLTAMTHQNLHCLALADILMPQLVHLVVLTSQAALLLKSQVQAIMQEDLDLESDTDIIELIGQSINAEEIRETVKENEVKEAEEHGFLAGLKIPAPWSSGKTLESIHPVRDNYKFKETVHIPGARCLYLRFDPRSSSQYDYDKRQLVLYAGPTTNSKKVAEYGGNTFGFGSRSVLGSGWPKDLVKMRSGREHNTPDKAMWGFHVTVRAQESTEEVSSGLPFLADLALGLSVLACTMLHLLYHGPEKSKEEISCEHLLKSKLLQREVIELDILEEKIISTVIKHLSLSDTVRALPSIDNQQSESFMLLRAVMEEVYRRLDALIRQLQSLAELEQRWHNEVIDHKQENVQSPPFFHDYHLQETKTKELTMLCFVKEISLEQGETEEAVKLLLEKFEEELALMNTDNTPPPMARTKHIVQGLVSRLDLLLQVTIGLHEGVNITRTLSYVESFHSGGMMVKSDTEVTRSNLARSISAPTGVEDDSVLEITKIYRKRLQHRRGPSSVLQDLVDDEVKDSPPHISSKNFLSAAQTRWRRGNTRKQALIHMKELLTAASRVGGATHLVAAVTSVLQHGPWYTFFKSKIQTFRKNINLNCILFVEELTCGGMVNQVREAFAETMTSVVQLAARYPIPCCNSIGLLCTIPYTRAEEKCLVRSGLVHLLDKLCSLANHRSDGSNTETQSTNQKVSAMAWAGFQVLANRCVMWETEDGSHLEELEHSGLARQVSVLLTNHLARATECIGNEAAGTEALQDVLSLLNNLSRSRMGRAILSQPACVSKLLSLLLDQRPSPKLVLIILQLCRVALPLMNTLDCEAVELPSWGQHLYSSHWSGAEPISDPPAKIASLLLAKLGDFLVPGNSDNRPFRLGGGTNMERVVRMDREMTKKNITGKAEITTEDAVTALKKAAKWAQMGLVVSTGPPVDTTQVETPTGDKKKTATEVTCREKNAELARTDPVRPFISGHVANTMAAEVIALLHSLLSTQESNSTRSWAEAVQRSRYIMMQKDTLFAEFSTFRYIKSRFANYLLDRMYPHKCDITIKSMNPIMPEIQHDLFEREHSARSAPTKRRRLQLTSAAWRKFSGLTQISSLRTVFMSVTGSGIHNTYGTVLTVSEQTGMAAVHLDTDNEFAPRYSDTVQVPVARLQPIRSEIHRSYQGPVTEAVVMAIKAILLPNDDNCPFLQKSLPVYGDGNSISNQICRVVAEIETRACMVLASYIRDIDFTKEFIQHCGSTIDVLKSLAKDCNPGDRLPVTELHCTRLRLLYRDCAKPPAPPSKIDSRANKETSWDANRSFPPVRSCIFSSGLTGVTFLGDPNTGSGLPRGTMIYANQPIPHQAPAFYWEMEICSFGDSQEESGAVVSFGFAPSADKKEGAWTNPVGTCLFLNNGKAVHYNGASLLQWRSVRLDVILNAGDIAGIGWERSGEAPVQGQTPKGRVYFTYNGRRLSAYMDDVSGCMYPVVHIQKKNTRIKANFGTRPFAFIEGQQHKDAADAASDLTREIRESFGHLPFHPLSDSDGEGQPVTNTEANIVENIKSPQGPPCKVAEIPKPQKDYDPEECTKYKLFCCFDNFVTTGIDHRSKQAQPDEESDDEAVEDDQGSEDHYALLVKAWEQKVFPVIRRRFRNEAERKDGLEQIRGALQLGMTDIARQTVEFLYEENGGIPGDLHLPTIDDIKEELAKFTIERVRKGTMVVIRNTTGTSTAGTTVLPKFAVRSMLRTFGLTGTVLDIDNTNELVQVETYLRSEGVLVRFWYPIDMLERPPQGMRKSTITGGQILDTSNVHIHGELQRCEGVLARMYCRTALLKLIDHCNSPAMEVGTCSTSLGSGMAASAALLQQLDIENLQLLSNELLCPPEPHGTILASSLTMSSSLQRCLSLQSCSLTRLIYKNEDKLKRELAVAIARAANQGEDYLIELTNQICLCLQTAPEMFAFEEFPVCEVKLNTDVHFPGAGCLVVSCKTDPRVGKKEDTSSTSNQNEQYTPAIIPCDRIHLRLGVSPPPGIMLTIHALSPQFLLAVAYIETLITEKYRCGTKSCGPKEDNSGREYSSSSYRDFQDTLWNVDNIVISPPVFKHVIELLCRYIWTTSIPALIKEYMFSLLAQSLRILHYSEGGNGCKLPTFQPYLNPTQGILVQLQKELQKLYEEETKGWTSATTASGTGMGIGVTDKGRFSTYFHSLMEVNLAIAELKYPEMCKSLPGAAASGSDATSSSSLMVLGSPTSTARKKKLKAKRDKERGGAVPKRPGGTSPRVSESESSSPAPASSSSLLSSDSSTSSASSASTPSTSSASLSAASDATKPSSSSSTNIKPEDLLWFHRALTVSQILRCLAFKEKHGESALSDAISDAAQVLNTPTAHSRLLVITGILPELSPESVKQTIRKACLSSGGIEMDEIFLPTCSKVAKPVLLQDMSKTDEKETTENKPEDKESDKSKVQEKKGHVLQGYAVIRVLSKTKTDIVKKNLCKCKALIENLSLDHEEIVDVPLEMLSVSTVSPTLISEANANDALEHYLQYKFFSTEQQKDISDSATLSLIEIFHSCFIMEQHSESGEYKQESGFICLGKDQILQNAAENLLCTFFNNIRAPKKSVTEQIMHVLRRYGMVKSPDKEMSPSGTDKNGKGKGMKKSPRGSKEKVVMGVVEKGIQKERKSKGKEIPEKSFKEASTSESGAKGGGSGKAWQQDETKYLTLDGFLQYVLDMAKQDIRTVWRAIMACGFDMNFERCTCLDASQAVQMAGQWSLDMDTALVHYVNAFSRKLAVSPSRLHPHEIRIQDSQLTSEKYSCFQGIPVESIRLRFALLQSLNNTLETFFLPLIDLRPAVVYNRSTAALLSKVRGLIFYDSKVNFMNRILNATAQRKPDQAAPEITLDPLENISGEEKNCIMTWCCQAYRQLSSISSSQFCVRLASGGDPTYSFNVKLTGEEVHGTSGSFRQFLWQIARELQGPHLKMLIPCNNTSNKGKCLLKPGHMTFSEEKLLHFFGQLLGITIRADIPIGMDLLSCFWKVVVGTSLDLVTDLQDADQLTYNYIKKIEMVVTDSELQALCADVYWRFVETDSELQALCADVEMDSELQALCVNVEMDSELQALCVNVATDAKLQALCADVETDSELQALCADVETDSELQALCADVYPKFVYSSMMGEEIELIPRGNHIHCLCVNIWENRQEYVDAIRHLRYQELMCEDRVLAIHSGLASLIPLQILNLMSPTDLEIRTCGIPVVDIEFLKAHTMYQVGLTETDPHIEFFWNTLEGLSQDDLCRFIKFACNQERIPQTCPCREGAAEATHVPPYPMKIAPPDGTGSPNSRFIRVETCMFMIKLPQYTSQEIMTEKLLYAINCREDPLSG
ncbi:hypothetical protein KUTeg_010226 [Tegillarca granosa]|uniref:HECT domain-containing protein n=1 Tax=Tegillarca granosa TaxID=220873 RepID=A0ABQ9FB30_TEGGR|nr:hypothetical protein KUTeg_010226 [Tegillarca granosa]